MSDKKEKLTPEQIKQIQQLQMMMQQQGAGNPPPAKKRTWLETLKNPNFSAKGLFIAILQHMQNAVKFVDLFTDFIVKKDSTRTNDVIKSARSPILFGAFVVIFFVLVALFWSGIAPLDSATVAIGTVMSNSKKKEINHNEGGIIKKIYVKVGDEVKQGDPLLEFDDTKTRSEYETYLSQYRTFLATETRLMAQINGDESIEYPEFLTNDKALPEVAKILETQNNLFRSKVELKISEYNSLKQRIHQSKKQIEGYEARKIATEKNLEATRDRLKATEKLYKQNYASKSTLLEMESKEANLQSEIAQIDAEISRAYQEITKTEIDLISLDGKTSTDALSELRDTQTNLSANRERFFSLQDSLKRIIIRSPSDGAVNNLNYHTIGHYIPPNHPIVEISPSGDRLIIEAKIEPRHIDSMRIGLVAKIRFSAFKSRTTPLFTGKVVSVSPDIIIDQVQRNPGDPTAAGYYLAKVEINMEEFDEVAKTRQLKLQPGMQAEVSIVTGTRTLLRYLLDPLFDAMFKGLKER